MTYKNKSNTNIPNPEVKPKRQKRQFTAAYKLDIVEQADACQGTGEIGALLRREGLYSSSLTKWRRQKAQGLLTKAQKKIQTKTHLTSSKTELDELKKRNLELEKRLKQAEAIIDVQKKVSEIFGITTNQTEKSEVSS